MNVPALSAIALVMLAVGASSGWILEFNHRFPHLMRKIRVVKIAPLRQAHIDWILMSVVLIGVDTVLPERPTWITAMIAYGAIINPLLFIPLAFPGPGLNRPVFQAALVTSFTSLSVGLVALAVYALI